MIPGWIRPSGVLRVGVGCLFIVAGVLKSIGVRSNEVEGTIVMRVLGGSENAVVAIAVVELALGLLLLTGSVDRRVLGSAAAVVALSTVIVLGTGDVGRRPCGCFAATPGMARETPAGLAARIGLVVASLLWLLIMQKYGARPRRRP
jgi:hypothetical protein